MYSLAKEKSENMFPQIQETILQLNAVLFFRRAHEMYQKHRVVPASGRDRGLDLICSFRCSNVSDVHSCYVGNRSHRIEEEDRISLHDFAKNCAEKKTAHGSDTRYQMRF